MEQARSIVVLGAGPAGVAVALGLQRLGHAVTVIGVPRPFDAIEGVSERVVASMQAVGIKAALAAIHRPSPRWAQWGGTITQANTERLIHRSRFDALLWDDLRAHGIESLMGRVTQWSPEDGGHGLSVLPVDGRQTVHLRASFVVEARGRQAPHPAGGIRRGPNTVALLCRTQTPPGGNPFSAVVSDREGWAWMARLPTGEASLQWSMDPDVTPLPARAQLNAWVLERVLPLAKAHGFEMPADLTWHAHARAATAWLVPQLCGCNWVRVGDAAMAADPLSGNGIFQSMSSALQAPMVINTLLRYPNDAAVAQQFHQARVAHLFDRFGRMGRDFYRQASTYPSQSTESTFWRKRCQWPDLSPTHPQPGKPKVVQKPVIDQDRIRLADVVVTEAQPLGVWRVGGVSAAHALEAAEGAPETRVQAISLKCQCSVERAEAVLRWMVAEDWLPPV